MAQLTSPFRIFSLNSFDVVSKSLLSDGLEVLTEQLLLHRTVLINLHVSRSSSLLSNDLVWALEILLVGAARQAWLIKWPSLQQHEAGSSVSIKRGSYLTNYLPAHPLGRLNRFRRQNTIFPYISLPFWWSHYLLYLPSRSSLGSDDLLMFCSTPSTSLKRRFVGSFGQPFASTFGTASYFFLFRISFICVKMVNLSICRRSHWVYQNEWALYQFMRRDRITQKEAG